MNKSRFIYNFKLIRTNFNISPPYFNVIMVHLLIMQSCVHLLYIQLSTYVEIYTWHTYSIHTQTNLILYSIATTYIHKLYFGHACVFVFGDLRTYIHNECLSSTILSKRLHLSYRFCCLFLQTLPSSLVWSLSSHLAGLSQSR